MLMEDMKAWYQSKGLALPIEYVKTEVVEANKQESYRKIGKMKRRY